MKKLKAPMLFSRGLWPRGSYDDEKDLRDRLLKKTDAMHGKTIASSAGLSDEFGIVFTDGTYIIFRAAPDYGDGASLELVTSVMSKTLIDLKLVTKFEWDQYWKLRQQADADSMKAYRKRMYLELKKVARRILDMLKEIGWPNKPVGDTQVLLVKQVEPKDEPMDPRTTTIRRETADDGKEYFSIAGIDYGALLRIEQESAIRILTYRKGYNGWFCRGSQKYYSPEFIVFTKVLGEPNIIYDPSMNDDPYRAVSFEYTKGGKKTAYEKALAEFGKEKTNGMSLR